MRVKLPGIAKATKRLADGTKAVYYYAWRGGPRLPGEPGSPEFVAAWNAAHAERRPVKSNTLAGLMDRYQRSAAFTDLAPRTRADYLRHIAAIDAEFGTMPIAALADRRVRGDVFAWRDRLAEKSPRQADYATATLARIIAWAYDLGHAPSNPLEKPGKLYRADRAERIWTEADEAMFRAAAPSHLWLALALAADTGQRQGDLIKLTWGAYDGVRLLVRQGKTRRRVVVPVSARLKAALDAAPRRALTVLTTLRGRPWTSDGFRTSWGKACDAAGIEGLTFHDLRGTAVTRLALAGCTVPEIASITGHSLRDVEAILDAHYLGRSNGLAAAAIARLESHREGTELANRLANRSGGHSEAGDEDAG